MGGLYGYALIQQRTRPWERVLGVKQWLDVDALGLTFEQCDPTQDDDASQPPMAMRINSNCVPLISSLINCFLHNLWPLRGQACASAERSLPVAGYDPEAVRVVSRR